MTLLDRIWGLLARTDAVTAPPAAASVRTERRDSVSNPLTGLGSATTDKGQVARPNPFVIPMSDLELRSLYAYNGMAARIVDILPNRAMRKGWTVPDIPATEDKRLKTWARTGTAWKMGDLYGGSVMLMVTEDDVPGEFRARPRDWLRQPLDLERVGKLHAIHVFDAIEVAPYAYEDSLQSVDFRCPSLWQFSSPKFSGVVHRSRALWMRGRERPPSEMLGGLLPRSNTMPDDSVLQVIWDECRRLTAIGQAGAVLAEEIRESVLKISGLDALTTGDQASELDARLALMQQSRALLNMTILGEGDDYENRSNPPTGFAELSDAAKSMLSAVTGIPETILFGSTPSGLNTDGESSWQGFRQLVSDYQEKHRPELERLYTVLYASQDGPTGGVVPPDWALEFASLDEPTAQETAELRKATAETDVLYIEAGVLTPEFIAKERFGPDGWKQELGEAPVPDADEQLERMVQAEIESAAAEPVPGDDPVEEPNREPDPLSEGAS